MIAAEAAAGLAGGIISGLDKLFTSDDERKAAKLKLAKLRSTKLRRLVPHGLPRAGVPQ